jgi:GDPmannose 4,6-dehydratase
MTSFIGAVLKNPFGKLTMTTRTALITGITGQRGAYLSYFLRRAVMYTVLSADRSSFNTRRVNHLYHDPNPRKNFYVLLTH